MIKPAPQGQRRPGRQRTGADETVLLSKITPPGLPDWAVRRPRIDKLIAQGAQRPLTIVTGPPGSGKTMALGLWAATHPDAVAWVTLDEYDNRPRVFWSQVIAALRQAGIAVPAAPPVPPARGLAAGHAFLLRLASAMAAQDPPVTLILDDLHLLTEPGVLAGLEYVLRNAGHGLHLVAASRMDPLLPLHRYRLAGQLTEIRASDLCFSALEARLLIAQHGITPSADSLARLLRRAEGWAAGLRLAAISMAGHPDPDQFIKEFAAEDSAVTGYLVEEVLNAQPGNVRDFLLSTSILNRVGPDLASDLTEDESAPDVLHALAQANAFVQPAGHGWYRYHSLFAVVLRLKLRRECPGRALDLHRRAARWYRRNGSLAEAGCLAGGCPDQLRCR
jgi:LuxR family maltose regulon positive regulatory protein